MLNSIILSLLVAWSAQAVKTPMSLEDLCQSSDLIVVVHVDPTSCPTSASSHKLSATPEADDDESVCASVQNANVVVLSALKGDAANQSLELCAPPISTQIRSLDLAPEQRQLVFLQRTPAGRYAAYSHVGRERIRGASLDPYRTAVSEYLQLQTIQNTALREQKLHQWRLELALDPLTRADGIRSLQTVVSAKGKSSQLVQDPAATPSEAVGLTAGETHRLVTALCSNASFGKTDQQLYKLLDQSIDPRLDAYALGLIRSWDGKIPWTGRYWIHQVVTRLGDPSALEFFNAHWSEFDSYFGGKDWSFTGKESTEADVLKQLLKQLAPAA
jgi:hypothetical protein